MLRHLVLFEDFLLKWGLATILIALPLYPKFPLFNVPGTYVAVRTEDFLIATVTFIFFFKILRNPKEFLSDRIHQAFFLFFLAGLLSVVAAIFLTYTVTPHLALLHWARRIEYVIPFFIAATIVRKEEHIRFYTEALLITSFIIFLYGLGQIYLSFPVISTQNEEFSKGLALKWVPGARLHSTFGGHYDLAAFLVLVLPLAFAYLFAVKKLFGRALILIAISASFWLLLTSSSRISVAAYFLGVGVTLWLLRRHLFLVPVIIVSLFFVLTTGDLAARYRYTLEVTTSRFYPLMSVLNPLKSQFQDWKEGITVWFEETGKPWLLSTAQNGRKRLTVLFARPLPTATPEVVVVLPTPTPEVTPTPKVAVVPATPGKVYVAPKRRKEASPTPTASPPPVIEDRSTAIRLNVEWPRALRAFMKNPILGTGYSSITLATDNDYLRILGEVGILGALAFSLVIFRIWKRVKYAIQNVSIKSITPSWAIVAGTIGGALGLLVNATFIDVFEASKVAPIFWVLTGVTIGVINRKLLKPAQISKKE